MIKQVVSALIMIFMLIPTVQAYSPPPASIQYHKLPPPRPHPDPGSPPAPRCQPLFGPYIKIQLPPRLIMTPDKLLFPSSGTTYSFVGDKFEPDGQQYLRHRVVTSLEGNGDGRYYVVSILGFDRDEPPELKDFRITFKEPISKQDVEKVGIYLKNPVNFVPTAQLTGAGCVPDFPNPKSHICLDTIIVVKGRTTRLDRTDVRQTIGVKGTFVPGNVAAPGIISGFSLGTQSLAVGGTVEVNGGTKLQQYLNTHTQTVISWSTISGTLDEIFAKGVSLGTSVDSQGSFNGRQYTANNWNLNASSPDPVVGSSTSFSSPPEGKIWKIVATGSNFDIGNGSGTTMFDGAGTVVVTGDQNQKVNLTFKQPLDCRTGTRLAFITEGDIKFEARPNDDYKLKVSCGSYTSLKGSINLSPSRVGGGDLKGIFVAKNNIVLPKPDDLSGQFIINRDNTFASHPTALLRELLKLVFSPS